MEAPVNKPVRYYMHREKGQMQVILEVICTKEVPDVLLMKTHEVKGITTCTCVHTVTVSLSFGGDV